MRRRAAAAAATTLLLWSAAAAAQVGAPAPPIEQGLLDCSLYRYGDRFDTAIAATMTRIAAATTTDAQLAAAFGGNARVDVTETLYRLGALRRVTDCAQPVLHGFAQNGSVALQIGALQSRVCAQLVASQTLRLQGLLVEPRYAPSGEARCGIARDQVPNALTLFGLTQASRMLPGENTVTVTARGPFAAAAPVKAMPSAPANCSSLARQGNSTIETMIETESYVQVDFPLRWQVEPCFDSIGGSSSVGLTCPAAVWNRYHDRLYAQFEQMMTRADSSHDPERFYSAAYWLIHHSDPMRLTIRSFDYVGRDCDLIRNRIVLGFGLCMWDSAKDAIQSAVQPPTLQDAGRRVREEMLNAVPVCFRETPKYYRDANEFIDAYLRPQPFLERRPEVLAQVARRVREAMARSGYGDCPYYAQAVGRIDQKVWRDQYAGGSAQLPIDWNHDFFQSAARCLATAR